MLQPIWVAKGHIVHPRVPTYHHGRQAYVAEEMGNEQLEPGEHLAAGGFVLGNGRFPGTGWMKQLQEDEEANPFHYGLTGG